MGIFKEETVVEEIDICEEDIEEELEDNGDFTVDGIAYDIKLTQRSLDLYESAYDPIMSTFIKNGGAFSVAQLRGILSYGLYVKGGGHVKPKKAQQIASKVIQTNGYAPVLEKVMEVIQRDCGFLLTGGDGSDTQH